jgi:hypothetical protein
MPRLGRHVLPLDAPIQAVRFAARFAVDIENQFGPVADHLHEELTATLTDDGN